MFTSLILCTHNPRRDYLDATIAGLRGQTLPCDQWEFLLIDNASSPERLPTANLDWNPNARLVHEDELGLTPARLRGIQESKGDLLVFVDDDNILDPNYLETALRIASSALPGSWSGQCRPVFDEPPPEWTRRSWGNLAIREFRRTSGPIFRASLKRCPLWCRPLCPARSRSALPLPSSSRQTRFPI